MLCVPSHHSALNFPPPHKASPIPTSFRSKSGRAYAPLVSSVSVPGPCCSVCLGVFSSLYPSIFTVSATPLCNNNPIVRRQIMARGAVVPVPVAIRHAAVVAVLVLAAAHGALCGHVEFAAGVVARGGGNAPSVRPGANVTGAAGEPAPSPESSLVGCGCGPAPAPWQFLNYKLAALWPVIQAFKKTITCDPLGVTATWEGPDLCSSFFNGTKYRGFYCEYPPNANATLTVASIDFNGFGLCAPSLVGFVDQFPDLALFHANSNNFSGDVPDLTHLPFFYELDLSNNNFSGSFPDAVVPLGGLLFLDLRFNRYAGAVPPAVFALTVEALLLNNNGFDGRIPDSFGSTGAKYLVVANNQFTGPIPRSIYNTSATLSEVLFLNNRLSGCLPYEIGLVEGLAVFDAGGNEIAGPIPLSFGCLRDVEEINLAGNQLYGQVPDVVCLLAKTGKLQNLSLSDNFFHSVGHHCMELVRSRVLDVRRNCILGFPDQRPALECAAFYADPTKHCPFIPHIPCDLPGYHHYPPKAAHGHVQGQEGGN
ncbi:hypothetical protein SETIT_3G032600v2 [Setaria italica]|uniref:Leucine-rich repeat-containing N-terminal plant-type domain-containing protein n=2 Tax=Setaria italica TaxID=4555 RepID=A0A368QB08_SETIT|nr:hypothetical protein SETIT_3G032600v2 [Setaria italica]